MRTAEARPASRVSLQVNGKSLRFRKAVVATGGRALIPQIDGLENVPYLTNANLFNLVDLPPRLVIIGAGPSSHRLGDPNSAPAQVRTRSPHTRDRPALRWVVVQLRWFTCGWLHLNSHHRPHRPVTSSAPRH